MASRLSQHKKFFAFPNLLILPKFHHLDQQFECVPENIMPMIIERLGNSSVATVPTLYDMILKNQLPKHKIKQGDRILFASVGAGMNINCIAYKA